MFVATFIAASKVIVSVLIGAFTVKTIPSMTSTLKDFSFLISMVLLPALTVSNTSRSVDLAMLLRCSILIFFSMLLISLGLLCGLIMNSLLLRVKPGASGIPLDLEPSVRLDLLRSLPSSSSPQPNDDAVESHHSASPSATTTTANDQHHHSGNGATGGPYVVLILGDHMRALGVDGHSIVPYLEVPDRSVEDYYGYWWGHLIGCSYQNGVTLPLSLLQNVALTVTWLDFAAGTAYIFVFSIVYMLYLWSAGPAMVSIAKKGAMKQRLIREGVMRHKKMSTKWSASTQTMPMRGGWDPIGNVGVARGPMRLEASDPSCLSRDSSEDVEAPKVNLHRRATAAPSGEAEDMASISLSLKQSFAQTEAPSPLLGVPQSFGDDKNESSGTEDVDYPDSICERFPYDWETAGYIHVCYERDVQAMMSNAKTAQWRQVLESVWRITKQLFVSPPFMSIVAGIVIGVVPPIRSLFFGGVLELIMDAVTVIGQGSIPSSLLLLGANLIGSTAAVDTSATQTGVRVRNAEQNTLFPLSVGEVRVLDVDLRGVELRDNSEDGEGFSFNEHASFILSTTAPGAVSATAAGSQGGGGSATEQEAGDSKKTTWMDGVRTALSLGHVKATFVWGIIVMRLVFAPAISFLVLISLIKVFPSLFGGSNSLDRTLIVVLITELASPTAINTTLIFNSQEFMTYPWAKMLFFQYLLCTITLVAWTSLGLSYVETLNGKG